MGLTGACGSVIENGNIDSLKDGSHIRGEGLLINLGVGLLSIVNVRDIELIPDPIVRVLESNAVSLNFNVIIFEIIVSLDSSDALDWDAPDILVQIIQLTPSGCELTRCLLKAHALVASLVHRSLIHVRRILVPLIRSQLLPV